MIETADKSKSQWITPTAINEIIRAYKTKLFVTKSVGELIRGYKDPLLSLAKLFVPSLVKDNKFSLLNGVSHIKPIIFKLITNNNLIDLLWFLPPEKWNNLAKLYGNDWEKVGL
jgi:hypothetical protein